jgi:cell division septation protein DedD
VGDPAIPPPASPGYTVSFAALLSQSRAQSLADSIVVGSARARVEAGEAAGVPLYRVVLGPYLTRADAEAAGRYTGRQFWIFEGQP